MSGMSDGVSNLWILRRDHGLDIDGHKEESDAVAALIRHALAFAKPDERPGIQEKFKAAIAKALTHCDPKPPETRTCNKHDDCDAAEARAKTAGKPRPDHCHSDDCEECFGS